MFLMLLISRQALVVTPINCLIYIVQELGFQKFLLTRWYYNLIIFYIKCPIQFDMYKTLTPSIYHFIRSSGHML